MAGMSLRLVVLCIKLELFIFRRRAESSALFMCVNLGVGFETVSKFKIF